MKAGFLIAAGLLALASSGAALAQGSKVSSAAELAAAADKLKPGDWVWAPQAAPEGPVTVLVDLTEQRAYIYRNGVNIGVSTVSSGKPGHETPTGVFQILQKDANHHSSTYNNAPMFFQERLTWDGVALHAGGLPGYPESHGCVHLPYTFAKELFGITHMGGTVVVQGKAGAPIRARAGGVLTPVDESGAAAAHTPLPPGTQWSWDDAIAAGAGPLSVVISSTDNRLVVLRGGKEVGRSAIDIEGDHAGTHVATLHRGADGKPHWFLVGLPGHADEANHALDATVLERLRMPKAFHQKLHPLVQEGTTVVVTAAGVGAHNSGREMTLVSAMDSPELL